MVGFHQITKPGDAGNPIAMFLGIINYFDNEYNARGFGLRNFSIRGYENFKGLETPGKKEYNHVIKTNHILLLLKLLMQQMKTNRRRKTQANGKIPYGNDK